MSQNQWASYSGQQLTSAYALEADAFGEIAMSPGFDSLISQFNDYDAYLEHLENQSSHRQTVSALLKNNGIIDTAVPSLELAKLFCLAQLAASAELFHSWQIASSKLNCDGMRELIIQTSASIRNIPAIPSETHPDQYSESQRQLLNGINVLQNVDTVRVMQILRLLGLISTTASDIHQVSLGVGNGYRDLFGIHLTPKITRLEDGSGVKFQFETVEKQAAHTVLVDNDPVYKNHFSGLNERESGRVLALNTDADQALKTLDEKQQESELSMRSSVVCLRLDHRMMPDVEQFLKSIASVIDSSADLIMTIGAGNNLLEFEGRLKCFDGLFEYLTQVGLNPVRVLLHGQGSAAEQRSNPNFGQLAYSSYQILYCKLDRSRLI
ncbi:MAG: hypothetical protein GKR91_08335 [Pseudomonadales bacterium]|nr:hypothetical protein [Pseudomonadales bacterium]